MRKLVLFALAWFVFVMWGPPLAVGAISKILLGSWKSQNTFQYIIRTWAITLVGVIALAFILRWLDVDVKTLLMGKFGRKEFFLATGVVLLFLSVEIAYFGGSYSPQLLRAFHYHLSRAQGNVPLAMIATLTEYFYYLFEIVAVNALYIGTIKFAGEANGVLAPVVFWGFAHVLNVITGMPPVQTLLLGVYMAMLALLTYSLARKTESLKVPIFTWLVSMVL
ncbi:hypothetical protein APY94_00630 [Thermococcus celericrescens]|uniref:CAAX protease n=1 Tax=Thermococcus celericrescens TaxID=227598 RepID=A0A124EBN6_9EURY|nr:hypothetical protein [Thermococcus celericrescens]KUH34720.1 hypothetical protein APY94_00630 [Thermococcus celericrescens]